jgi:hypothetical protein
VSDATGSAGTGLSTAGVVGSGGRGSSVWGAGVSTTVSAGGTSGANNSGSRGRTGAGAVGDDPGSETGSSGSSTRKGLGVCFAVVVVVAEDSAGRRKALALPSLAVRALVVGAPAVQLVALVVRLLRRLLPFLEFLGVLRDVGQDLRVVWGEIGAGVGRG